MLAKIRECHVSNRAAPEPVGETDWSSCNPYAPLADHEDWEQTPRGTPRSQTGRKRRKLIKKEREARAKLMAEMKNAAKMRKLLETAFVMTQPVILSSEVFELARAIAQETAGWEARLSDTEPCDVTSLECTFARWFSEAEVEELSGNLYLVNPQLGQDSPVYDAKLDAYIQFRTQQLGALAKVFGAISEDTPAYELDINFAAIAEAKGPLRGGGRGHPAPQERDQLEARHVRSHRPVHEPVR